jgi:hypothetical protein
MFQSTAQRSTAWEMTERPPADHHPLEVSFIEAPEVVDSGAPVQGGAGVVFKDVDRRV